MIGAASRNLIETLPTLSAYTSIVFSDCRSGRYLLHRAGLYHVCLRFEATSCGKHMLNQPTGVAPEWRSADIELEVIGA